MAQEQKFYADDVVQTYNDENRNIVGSTFIIGVNAGVPNSIQVNTLDAVLTSRLGPLTLSYSEIVPKNADAFLVADSGNAGQSANITYNGLKVAIKDYAFNLLAEYINTRTVRAIQSSDNIAIEDNNILYNISYNNFREDVNKIDVISNRVPGVNVVYNVNDSNIRYNFTSGALGKGFEVRDVNDSNKILLQFLTKNSALSNSSVFVLGFDQTTISGSAFIVNPDAAFNNLTAFNANATFNADLIAAGGAEISNGPFLVSSDSAFSGSTAFNASVTFNDDLIAASGADISGGTFNCSSTNPTFVNNLRVEREDSTINVAFFAANTYQANGDTSEETSFISQYKRGDTSSLFDGGRWGFKKVRDYSSFAESETEFRMQNCTPSSGNTVSFTSSSNGNFTLKAGGSYFPFSACHIARAQDNEKLTGFKEGLIVDIVRTEITDEFAHDTTIEICSAKKSKKTYGILKSEIELVVNVDGLYSDDENEREKARINIDQAKTFGLDFYKKFNAKKPQRLNSGKQEKLIKPKNIKVSQVSGYSYAVFALGNGVVWVTNSNGPIKIGDFISSFSDGYGERYTDGGMNAVELQDVYCVAKASQDEDFSENYEIITINSIEYRAKKIAVRTLTG